MDIIRQSACLVVNPITVYVYGGSGLRLNNDPGVKFSSVG